MNVHWTSASASTMLPVAAPKRTLSFTEWLQDAVGRFGMLGLIAIFLGMMAYGFAINQTATSDKCFANLFLLDCVE